MKTPREILLHRHRAAAARLDAIRRQVVNREFVETREAAVKLPDLLTLPLVLWRELILPSRWIWSGLAAVWLALLAIHLSLQPAAVTITHSSPASEMILTFHQDQKLLRELIGPDESRPAQSPQPILPQPRSERRTGLILAQL